MASAGHDHVPVNRGVLEILLAGAGMTTWLQYVTHDRVEAYRALGWKIESTLDGSAHSNYSVLMKWVGEGEPPKPVEVAHVLA